MYEYLKGKFISKNSSDKGFFVVIDVHDIGYCIELR